MSSKRYFKTYKRVEGSSIVVDEFRFPNVENVTHWFLSHAHGDHYNGLDSTWEAGLIYMSHLTAKLIIHMLQVDPKYCIGLPLDERIALDGTCNDAHVTLKDAYHCPGAVVFVFDFALEATEKTSTDTDGKAKTPIKEEKVDVQDKKRRRYIMHTGDFRYHAATMAPWVESLKAITTVDIVYLDTTYLRKSHDFPPQDQVLEWLSLIADHIVEEDKETSSTRTLLAVSTYNIGKEKVVKRLIEATGSKAIVESRKLQRLILMDDPLPHIPFDEFTGNEGIYICDWGTLGTSPQEMFGKGGNPWSRFETLLKKVNSATNQGFPKFTRVLAFHASGWTWSKKVRIAYQKKSLEPQLRSDDGRFGLYNIPYSEHSSYTELIEFLKLLKPNRIIPTVGSDEDIAKNQMKLLDHYQNRRILRQQAIQKIFMVSGRQSSEELIKRSEVGEAPSTPASTPSSPNVPSDIPVAELPPTSPTALAEPETLTATASESQIILTLSDDEGDLNVEEDKSIQQEKSEMESEMQKEKAAPKKKASDSSAHEKRGKGKQQSPLKRRKVDGSQMTLTSFWQQKAG